MLLLLLLLLLYAKPLHACSQPPNAPGLQRLHPHPAVLFGLSTQRERGRAAVHVEFAVVGVALTQAGHLQGAGRPVSSAYGVAAEVQPALAAWTVQLHSGGARLAETQQQQQQPSPPSRGLINTACLQVDLRRGLGQLGAVPRAGGLPRQRAAAALCHALIPALQQADLRGSSSRAVRQQQ